MFAGNASEPKTLAEMLEKLIPGDRSQAPTVVLDAGIATEENIEWLVSKGYRYLVVSRKRQRQFDDDQAVIIKQEGDLSIRAPSATTTANMPPLVQDLALINPMRHFLIIVGSVFLEDLPAK